MDCLFCKIIKKEIPAQIVFETEDVLAFRDIHPAHEHHILVVPKKHFDGISSMEGNFSVCTRLIEESNRYAKEQSWPAYKLLVNNGKPFQEIAHLHFHLMAGKPIR